MTKRGSKIKYKKLENYCIDIILKNNIMFFDEIFIDTDITPSEFYLYELEKSEKIKDLIDTNRAKLKRELRQKWLESTNATLNAALYKLVCSEEEKRSLSSSSSGKNTQTNDICTQEEYLKSLKEMSEVIDNAD